MEKDAMERSAAMSKSSNLPIMRAGSHLLLNKMRNKIGNSPEPMIYIFSKGYADISYHRLTCLDRRTLKILWNQMAEICDAAWEGIVPGRTWRLGNLATQVRIFNDRILWSYVYPTELVALHSEGEANPALNSFTNIMDLGMQQKEIVEHPQQTEAGTSQAFIEDSFITADGSLFTVSPQWNDEAQDGTILCYSNHDRTVKESIVFSPTQVCAMSASLEHDGVFRIYIVGTVIWQIEGMTEEQKESHGKDRFYCFSFDPNEEEGNRLVLEWTYLDENTLEIDGLWSSRQFNPNLLRRTSLFVPNVSPETCGMVIAVAIYGHGLVDTTDGVFKPFHCYARVSVLQDGEALHVFDDIQLDDYIIYFQYSKIYPAGIRVAYGSGIFISTTETLGYNYPSNEYGGSVDPAWQAIPKPDWSDTATYDTDDYVTTEDGIWRCTKDDTTGIPGLCDGWSFISGDVGYYVGDESFARGTITYGVLEMLDCALQYRNKNLFLYFRGTSSLYPATLFRLNLTTYEVEELPALLFQPEQKVKLMGIPDSVATPLDFDDILMMDKTAAHIVSLYNLTEVKTTTLKDDTEITCTAYAVDAIPDAPSWEGGFGNAVFVTPRMNRQLKGIKIL